MQSCAARGQEDAGIADLVAVPPHRLHLLHRLHPHVGQVGRQVPGQQGLALLGQLHAGHHKAGGAAAHQVRVQLSGDKIVSTGGLKM